MASGNDDTTKQTAATRGSSATPKKKRIRSKVPDYPGKPGPKPGSSFKNVPTKNKKILPTEEVITIERRIYELASVGATLGQIASVLRLGETVLRERMALNEKLPEAYKNGRDDFACFAMGKLAEQVRSGVLGAIIFYLKTQVGWRETNNLNLVGVSSHVSSFMGRQDQEEEMQSPVPLLTDEELETMQRLLENAERRNAELKTQQQQGKPN